LSQSKNSRGQARAEGPEVLVYGSEDQRGFPLRRRCGFCKSNYDGASLFCVSLFAHIDCTFPLRTIHSENPLIESKDEQELSADIERDLAEVSK
jgi:hypothetical protein